jgi:hypothetical protein
LIRGAQRRSKDTPKEVTIKGDQIAAILDSGYCQATGLPFDMDSTKFSHTSPLAPSLDRKDNSKGYTPDNTQVVVWIYNNAKSDWGEGALNALAHALVNRIGEKNV